jgi:hypothetical protein
MGVDYRFDILKRSVGLACAMDGTIGDIVNIADTFIDMIQQASTDIQEILDFAKAMKPTMRAEYVFGYDESWFDLWWENVGFDNIERYDDELESYVYK